MGWGIFGLLAHARYSSNQNILIDKFWANGLMMAGRPAAAAIETVYPLSSWGANNSKITHDP
jgi:hypothetical protein